MSYMVWVVLSVPDGGGLFISHIVQRSFKLAFATGRLGTGHDHVDKVRAGPNFRYPVYQTQSRENEEKGIVRLNDRVVRYTTCRSALFLAQV